MGQGKDAVIENNSNLCLQSIVIRTVLPLRSIYCYHSTHGVFEDKENLKKTRNA